MNLNEKVIVVTGSSKGLGRELSIALSKMGASIVVNYYHSQKAAMETLEDIKIINKRVIAVKADVSNPKDVLFMYKKILQEFGKVDVLINNAGIGEGHLINNMRVEAWEQTINTNLTGCFLCCKQFSKQMIKQRSGKIINISSRIGELGEKGLSGYCASKAGINSLTKTLAKELARYNIAVNAICPGPISTELNSNTCSVSYSSLFNNKYTISDFINFTVLMASDKIKNVSGQIFQLDSRV